MKKVLEIFSEIWIKLRENIIDNNGNKIQEILIKVAYLKILSTLFIIWL